MKTFFVNKFVADLQDVENLLTVLQTTAKAWSIKNETDQEITVFLEIPRLNHIHQRIGIVESYKASDYARPEPEKILMTKINVGEAFSYDGDSLPTQSLVAGTKIILKYEVSPTIGKVKMFYNSWGVLWAVLGNHLDNKL